MRATLPLSDALLVKARAATGLTETPALAHEALKALIGRESTSRLAASAACLSAATAEA